ncbi:MAG: hypothetical protein R6W74_04325 [Nitrosomonas halophila]
MWQTSAFGVKKQHPGLAELLNLVCNFRLGWRNEDIFSLFERAPPWLCHTVSRQLG